MALTVLPPLVHPSRAAARRRRLEALPGARHHDLIRTLDVVHLPDGQDVVVTERVDGPTLVALRASRGPFTRGEMASVLTSLGRALEALHAVGVVHGDVSPANVLARADGSPVLLDLAGEAGFESGTAGFRPPEIERGGAASRAGDVWSAASTVLWMASPDDRDEIESLLSAALGPDPAERCGPGHLAVLASGFGEPGPLTTPAAPLLAGGAIRARASMEPTRVAGRRTRRRPSHPHRRLRAIVAVLSGVLAGALIAAVAVPGDPREARYAPGPRAVTDTSAGAGDDAAREEVIGRVSALIGARDQALVRADPAELASVTVPGSPAASADARVLAALEASGTRITGLRTDVERVDVRRIDAATAEAEVVTTQRSYVRSTGGGDEVVPRQPPRCVLLELTQLDGRWLVRRTAPCPDPTS